MGAKTKSLINLFLFFVLFTPQLNAADNMDIQRFPPSSQNTCDKNGLLVLIPGTFNSLMPSGPGEFFTEKHYFSENIFSTLNGLGFDILIVTNLLPTGTIEINGTDTLKQIESYHAKACSPETPIYMIGHSAGGLYGLYALHLNPKLPFKSLYMMATPLQGLTIADAFFQNPLTHQWLEDLIANNRNVFDANGLTGLQSTRVREFISRLRIPDQVELWTIIGEQQGPPTILDVMDANRLSPLFTAIDSFIGGGSDGVIDRPSAMGTQVTFQSLSKRRLSVQTYPQTMPLDHLEQILDYRIIQLEGFMNADDIRKKQNRFYQDLGQFILSKRQ